MDIRRFFNQKRPKLAREGSSDVTLGESPGSRSSQDNSRQWCRGVPVANASVGQVKFSFSYIYAFNRCFYPKRLTVHSGYTFFFPGNRTHNLCAANAMLWPLSHRNTVGPLKNPLVPDKWTSIDVETCDVCLDCFSRLGPIFTKTLLYCVSGVVRQFFLIFCPFN